ncbi:hypothetical protein ACX0G7_09740 [Flavitalea antarctica]
MRKLMITTPKENLEFEIAADFEFVEPKIEPYNEPCAYSFRTKGEGVLIIGRNVLADSIIVITDYIKTA